MCTTNFTLKILFNLLILEIFEYFLLSLLLSSVSNIFFWVQVKITQWKYLHEFPLKKKYHLQKKVHRHLKFRNVVSTELVEVEVDGRGSIR